MSNIKIYLIVLNCESQQICKLKKHIQKNGYISQHLLKKNSNGFVKADRKISFRFIALSEYNV